MSMAVVTRVVYRIAATSEGRGREEEGGGGRRREEKRGERRKIEEEGWVSAL